MPGLSPGRCCSDGLILVQLGQTGRGKPVKICCRSRMCVLTMPLPSPAAVYSMVLAEEKFHQGGVGVASGRQPPYGRPDLLSSEAIEQLSPAQAQRSSPPTARSTPGLPCGCQAWLGGSATSGSPWMVRGPSGPTEGDGPSWQFSGHPDWFQLCPPSELKAKGRPA